MKLVMLAHPPNPNPTTKTHTTMNALNTYIAVQLGMKIGGFSAAFYKTKSKLCHIIEAPTYTLPLHYFKNFQNKTNNDVKWN